MNYLIVESPTKSRKIQSMLGKDWTVLASYGHVRDLPVKSLGLDLKTFRTARVRPSPGIWPNCSNCATRAGFASTPSPMRRSGLP